MTKQITMGDKDMLLVAKSNPISYKIAYNLDGGKHSDSSFNGQYFLKKFYPLS